MTEGLFLLTTLFVAYVVYVIVNEKKAIATGTKKTATAAAHPEPQPQAIVVEKPATETPKAKPVARKTAAAKPAAPKKTKVAAVPDAPVEPAAIKGTGLKDPKTGEVAKTYTNYRFTKRWIKDALVTEGLVDKVYKNDELNADVETKIKAGLIKLEGMKKYKP